MVRYLNRLVLGAAALSLSAAVGLAPVHAQPPTPMKATSVSQTRINPVPYPDALREPEPGLRVATFNASLNRASQGQLERDLQGPGNIQARAVAEVIQRNAPDILLLNEFDYDPDGASAELFRTNYLAVSQGGQSAIDYPYIYLAPSNTGIQSGADLDGDGIIGGPGDALGFGHFEGQYAMVLYSKYPIDAKNVRTFQNFLWKDMPGSQLPAGLYSELVRGVLRLPSKSMWDVPVKIGTSTIHVIAAHPAPPAFDGPEKRNKRRNHDEIRLVNDYLGGGKDAGYIYDDAGVKGPLKPGSNFVVMGDLNSDVNAGDSDRAGIDALLSNPLLVDPLPMAGNGPGAVNPHVGREGVSLDALSTADFGRGRAGVMRIDYVLPSRSLNVGDAGVYWPVPGWVGSELVNGWPPPTSDHRLVWVDLEIPE